MSGNKRWFIYVLIDPRDRRIRYVGWTYNVTDRYKRHLRDKNKTHKAHWIQLLRTNKLKPLINVIESGEGDNWAERETYWIEYYKSQGANLTNMSNGGEGLSGYTAMQETRELQRLKALGRKASDETKMKLSQMRKGRIVSAETKIKMSISSPKKKKVKRLEDGKIYNMIKDAAKDVNVCNTAISNALKLGTISGGYHWVYCEDEIVTLH